MNIPNGFYRGWNRKALDKNKGPSYHGLVVNNYGWNVFKSTPSNQQPPVWGLEMSLPMEYLK